MLNPCCKGIAIHADNRFRSPLKMELIFKVGQERFHPFKLRQPLESTKHEHRLPQFSHLFVRDWLIVDGVFRVFVSIINSPNSPSIFYPVNQCAPAGITFHEVDVNQNLTPTNSRIERVRIFVITGMLIKSIIAGLYQVFNVETSSKVTETFIKCSISDKGMFINRHI